MKQVYTLLCLVSIVLVAGPAAAEADSYWSIVLSQEADGGYHVGWASDVSKAAAMRGASGSCREHGGSKCREVASFANACMAVAIGDNGYGTGGGDSKANAERKARARCRSGGNSNCSILDSGCAN